MPAANVYFDHGSGTCVWLEDAADCWADPEQLPVSATLRAELLRLVDWYDTALNRDYPPDPGPWREPECERFNTAVRDLVVRLRTELGADWVLHDCTEQMHEDPDLDRYLADPAGFRR